jgi:hypothetical protein
MISRVLNKREQATPIIGGWQDQDFSRVNDVKAMGAGLALLHFAARCVDLVYLVYLVSLVCLVGKRNNPDKLPYASFSSHSNKVNDLDTWHASFHLDSFFPAA